MVRKVSNFMTILVLNKDVGGGLDASKYAPASGAAVQKDQYKQCTLSIEDEIVDFYYDMGDVNLKECNYGLESYVPPVGFVGGAAAGGGHKKPVVHGQGVGGCMSSGCKFVGSDCFPLAVGPTASGKQSPKGKAKKKAAVQDSMKSAGSVTGSNGSLH